MQAACGNCFGKAFCSRIYRIYPTELLGVTWTSSLYMSLRADGSWVGPARLHHVSVFPAGRTTSLAELLPNPSIAASLTEMEPRIAALGCCWALSCYWLHTEGFALQQGHWDKGINLELAKRRARCQGSSWVAAGQGFILSSPNKKFILHQTVLSWQPGRFSSFWFPHEAVFCTEMVLHSLGKGFGVLEQVPVCCYSSSWGHIPSWPSGDPSLPSQRGFPPSDGFDPHLPAGPVGQHQYLLGPAVPTQLPSVL